jgi:Cytochrome bd terminal oxidase subunit I
MTSRTFIDLSRWQFATTAAFHMTFPALSVGLAIFLVICYGARLKAAQHHRQRPSSADTGWSPCIAASPQTGWLAAMECH